MNNMDRQAVYLPPMGEILVVRGSIGSRTTLWNLKVLRSSWLPSSANGEFPIRLSGNITGAEFRDDVDERVTNQKASINRLLDHLKHHCPNLRRGPGDLFSPCDWEE